MKTIPEDMTICNLEVLIMPNGEILSNGKSIGWFGDFKDYLEEKPKKKEESTDDS